MGVSTLNPIIRAFGGLCGLGLSFDSTKLAFVANTLVLIVSAGDKPANVAVFDTLVEGFSY